MSVRRRESKRTKEPRQQNEESKDGSKPTSYLVIDLLNKASMPIKDSEKVSQLYQVQELVINKEPQLLDNFLDEIVGFQADRSQDVRKFVVGFMEEACKKDVELFSKLLLNFRMALGDEVVGVIKKAIQSFTQIFRICIEWISTSKKSSKETLERGWKVYSDITNTVSKLLDSENDGIRTQSVKFMEKVILTLSEDVKFSQDAAKCSSLDLIPLNAIVKKEELKNLGEKSLQSLLKFVASPSVSSVNLIASLGTLTNIARQRPHLMSTVVQAFETLHADLPPTLAKTQVTTVRKHMKMQLLNLLKLATAVEFHQQITNLLYDLGTTNQEIARTMVKVASQSKKPAKRAVDAESETAPKKIKIEVKEDYDEEEQQMKAKEQISAIDVTADELTPLLTPENVANLVLLSMVMLPDKIPDAFQASYTPIESAGTMEQMMHLARLLAIQMTAVGIGSGIKYTAQLKADEDMKRKMDEEKRILEQEKNTHVPIQTLIGGTTTKEEKEIKKEEEMEVVPVAAVPTKSLQRRIQGFHLASITKPLSLDEKDKIIKMAVLRVLKAEKSAIAGRVHNRWQKILTSLVAQFGGDLHRSLAQFILSDIKNRSELAFQWVYEEFNIYLENARGANDKAAMENYNACLTRLLQGLLDKHDTKESLFSRLVMQAPLITDNAIELIKKYCQDERHFHTGLILLHNMLKRRPTMHMKFLRVLLDLTSVSSQKVSVEAIRIANVIYNSNANMKEYVEHFAIAHLQYLVNKSPPKEVLGDEIDLEKPEEKKSWDETTIKRCFMLFLSLLPYNHVLIHKLAEIYVEAIAEIKRVILRSLEEPVVGMGMESIEVLKLVESCPKGAETLVTRLLHILTDKEHPSAELVAKVRDLYHKRVPDVRFLIPVLNGLTKEEVLVAIPKLIRLNPPIVKGVFTRLLGVQRISSHAMSALTPEELLVALHNIDGTKADVKCVIKATSLCFAEKTVYTSEVLVTVINHLVEQEVMPTLLMRTVIQSLISYPRLSGFVMNVLQRLILKRVWEQSQVWEGFIKCCQRLKPQSFQVLLQLPPEQLLNVFKTLPEIKEPLLQYVNKFTPQQKQHVSLAILSVLETNPANQHQVRQTVPRSENPIADSINREENVTDQEKNLPENNVSSNDQNVKMEVGEQAPFPNTTAVPVTMALDNTQTSVVPSMVDIKPVMASTNLVTNSGMPPGLPHGIRLPPGITLPPGVVFGLPPPNIRVPPPNVMFPTETQDNKRSQRSSTPTMDE